MADNEKEILAEERQIYMSPKNNYSQPSYQSPEAQESTEEWSV